MGSKNLWAKDCHVLLLMGSHRNRLIARAMVADPPLVMAVPLMILLVKVVAVPHLHHHLVDRLTHVDMVAVAAEVGPLYLHQDPFPLFRILLTPRRSL